jgi:hypothetical protein
MASVIQGVGQKKFLSRKTIFAAFVLTRTTPVASMRAESVCILVDLWVCFGRGQIKRSPNKPGTTNPNAPRKSQVPKMSFPALGARGIGNMNLVRR